MIQASASWRLFCVCVCQAVPCSSAGCSHRCAGGVGSNVWRLNLQSGAPGLQLGACWSCIPASSPARSCALGVAHCLSLFTTCQLNGLLASVWRAAGGEPDWECMAASQAARAGHGLLRCKDGMHRGRAGGCAAACSRLPRLTGRSGSVGDLRPGPNSRPAAHRVCLQAPGCSPSSDASSGMEYSCSMPATPAAKEQQNSGVDAPTITFEGWFAKCRCAARCALLAQQL